MNCTGTVKCHTGVALRGWSHLHLSPTETPLSCWQVWFHTCRAQLGPNSTSAGWCVRKGPGRAHIIQAQVKPQHIGSENCKSGDTLRSVPPSPIPDRLSRAHPCQSTQKRLLLPVLSHSHQEPLFPSQHMHHEAQGIYMLINIYSSRTIKDRVINVGSARFINMHIK
jgi:hypothetical protein